jgi:hypothetical protein
MGRELRRVPMDFDWPMKRIWKGYINPYRGINCPWCYDEDEKHSDGMTKEAREYKKAFYGFMNDWQYIQHPYKPRQQYCPKSKPYSLERWEYDFLISDNEWETRKRLFGDGEIPSYENITDYFLKYGDMEFDGCIEWALINEYCRRNGYEVLCPHCKGNGTIYINEEIEKLNDEWRPIEPPEGDGYQLWETTSEGSPVSPVFATLDELCEWCEDNATTFGTSKATKEEWMQMLDDGFVCHKEGNIIFM